MLLFWEQYGFYLWLLTALLLCGLAGAFVLLWRRISRAIANYQALTRGVDGVALDSLLLERAVQVQHHDEQLAEALKRLAALEQSSVRRVGLIRFNPFNDLGGDQSFSLALLDGENDGVVLSSIYNRSGTRLYAKGIRSGQSSYQLSAEELDAIARAAAGGELAVQELS